MIEVYANFYDRKHIKQDGRDSLLYLANYFMIDSHQQDMIRPEMIAIKGERIKDLPYCLLPGQVVNVAIDFEEKFFSPYFCYTYSNYGGIVLHLTQLFILNCPLKEISEPTTLLEIRSNAA